MTKEKDLATRLGYDPGTKLLIIHADDAGLAHAENRATIDALTKGVVNSYSIMVPCPWFFEIGTFARQHPNYDHGVHLTLTCEWNSYKFGPVLGQKEVPSLVDSEGNFFKTRKELVQNARIDEVRKELCGQIDRALSFGLKPTHLDSHMYSLGSSMEFLDLYRELGKRYKLPVMLNSKLIEEIAGTGMEEFDLSDEILIDHLYLGNFEDFKKGRLTEYYTNSLKSLRPGLNMILIHPAYDEPEMRAVTINHPNFGAEWRQKDLDFFTSRTCRDLLTEQQIQLVSWGEIGKVMYP